MQVDLCNVDISLSLLHVWFWALVDMCLLHVWFWAVVDMCLLHVWFWTLVDMCNVRFASCSLSCVVVVVSSCWIPVMRTH